MDWAGESKAKMEKVGMDIAIIAAAINQFKIGLDSGSLDSDAKNEITKDLAHHLFQHMINDSDMKVWQLRGDN